MAPPDPDPVTPVALVTDPQVTGDRWYDAAYSPYFSYFYPTHWRPLT